MVNDNDLGLFKVDWANRSQLRGPGERSLERLLLKLRDRLASEAKGISVTYLNNRVMKKRNKECRNVNQPTDVLSFPANFEKGAFPYLGDIVICLPVAEKMSKKLGVSRRREVETLVIHGFLHLCGYDHETDSGEMMALQAELERDLLGSEPLAMTVKRGRKPGSKVKCLKDGRRIVVNGRAASVATRREFVQTGKCVSKLSKNLDCTTKISIVSSSTSEKKSVGRVVCHKVTNKLRKGVLS